MKIGKYGKYEKYQNMKGLDNMEIFGNPVKNENMRNLELCKMQV